MYDHIFPKHLMTWGNFHHISENSGYMQFDLIVDCLLPTLTYRFKEKQGINLVLPIFLVN